MPVAVHLSPAMVPLDDGQPGVLRLTVACGPAAGGRARSGSTAPDGIVLAPSGPLRYDLRPARATQAFELTVTARPGTAARPPVRDRTDR